MKKIFKIPGVTFSLKRLLGITKIKQQIARKTGIPTTVHGIKHKIKFLLQMTFCPSDQFIITLMKFFLR